MALQEEWYATHSTTGATTNIDFVAILPGTVNTSLGYHAIYGKASQLVTSLLVSSWSASQSQTM